MAIPLTSELQVFDIADGHGHCHWLDVHPHCLAMWPSLDDVQVNVQLRVSHRTHHEGHGGSEHAATAPNIEASVGGMRSLAYTTNTRWMDTPVSRLDIEGLEACCMHVGGADVKVVFLQADGRVDECFGSVACGHKEITCTHGERVEYALPDDEGGCGLHITNYPRTF